MRELPDFGSCFKIYHIRLGITLAYNVVINKQCFQSLKSKIDRQEITKYSSYSDNLLYTTFLYLLNKLSVKTDYQN